MKPHPYLRAYMAGVAVPSVFLLFIFAASCVVRFGYNPAFPVERIIMFPVALVPAIWGAWNMVYLALRAHHGPRYSLGLHGAVVPLVLVPSALQIMRALDFPPALDAPRFALIVVPLLMLVYYLVWKYFVAFLNEVLGIA